MPSVNPLDEIKTLETTNGLPRQQKIAVVILAIITISIIVIWALQLSFQINKPFTIPKNNKGVVATTTDPKLLDSDGDGLSDYDEINTYKTSPYLEDSDSDGIFDKQEIEQGTDPNCPTGKNCNSSESLPATSGSTASSTFESLTSGAGTSLTATSSEVTPDMLRQILLQNGYDKATLDKISDEDIMRSYQEALKTQAGNSSTSNTDSTSTVVQ